jgi:hypothetical protein
MSKIGDFTIDFPQRNQAAIRLNFIVTDGARVPRAISTIVGGISKTPIGFDNDPTGG